MKLCVIGNSHAGMLAQAHRTAPRSDMELTFFAREGRGPQGARLSGTELYAADKGLRRALKRLAMPTRVDLATFDALVIVGMTVTVFSIANMLSTHAVHGWPGSDDADRPLVSEAALEASLGAGIVANLARGFVDQFRQVTPAPILLVPQPCPSQEALTNKHRFAALRQLRWRKQGACAMACVRRAHLSAFGDVDKLCLLAQPNDTLIYDFLTQSAYTRGAGRLNATGRQPEHDVLHANAAYGGLVLDQIAAAMGDN